MIARGDAARLPLASRSVDLVFGSPPYIDARRYYETGSDGRRRNLGISRKLDAWVAWMLRVTAECLRVSRGPVLWVIGGPTRGRNYQPAAECLIAAWRKGVGSGVYLDGLELPRLKEADCTLYRPVYWHRSGIAGTGGRDWFRADVEQVCCFKRPGELPWADNTAMGKPAKYAPGGEMSFRSADGTRVNDPNRGRNQWGSNRTTSIRNADGDMEIQFRPSHRYSDDNDRPDYVPPEIANPGNLVSIPVGGGKMGHPLAHENEAPFPQALAAWFVPALCPPEGLVLDPFSGSASTEAAARECGRRGVSIDLRQSQCVLGARRLSTPSAPPRPRRRKRAPSPSQRSLFD